MGIGINTNPILIDCQSKQNTGLFQMLHFVAMLKFVNTFSLQGQKPGNLKNMRVSWVSLVKFQLLLWQNAKFLATEVLVTKVTRTQFLSFKWSSVKCCGGWIWWSWIFPNLMFLWFHDSKLHVSCLQIWLSQTGKVRLLFVFQG